MEKLNDFQPWPSAAVDASIVCLKIPKNLSVDDKFQTFFVSTNQRVWRHLALPPFLNILEHTYDSYDDICECAFFPFSCFTPDPAMAPPATMALVLAWRRWTPKGQWPSPNCFFPRYSKWSTVHNSFIIIYNSLYIILYKTIPTWKVGSLEKETSSDLFDVLHQLSITKWPVVSQNQYIQWWRPTEPQTTAGMMDPAMDCASSAAKALRA